MTALDILDAIQSTGASVKVSADKLLVVGRVPPELLSELSGRRLEVAALIREHDESPCASDIVRAAEAIAKNSRSCRARIRKGSARTSRGMSSA